MPMLRVGECLRADDRVKVFGQWIPVGRSNAGHRVSNGGRFPAGWYRRDSESLHHVFPVAMDASGSMSDEQLKEALRMLSNMSNSQEGIVLRHQPSVTLTDGMTRPVRRRRSQRDRGKEPHALEQCSGKCKYFFDGIDECRTRECPFAFD
jgi:hypothetical protein